MKRVRVIAALAALAALVITALLPAVGVVAQLATTENWFRPRDDPVSAIDRRYAPLREALRGERVVGLVPPVPPEVKAYRAYLVIARYALAPTFVVYETKPPLLIVDGAAARRSAPPDFTLRRDFGNGLQILERQPR